jgi:adenylate cyclase
MRLNPYHPERFWSHLGRAQYTARLYSDAIASYSRLTAPDAAQHAFMAASAAQLGDRVAAAAHAGEVLRRQPSFTVKSHQKTLHYRLASDNDHMCAGLLKAGLPE